MSFYRVTVGGKGIYEAVDRDCPKGDIRRKNKPDGSWLAKVGKKYPGAVSYWTEVGWKKYQDSGLFSWHASVCKSSPVVEKVEELSGRVVYQDQLQVLVEKQS
jgi:hypothetical protein